jgi:hypothetical protein
LVSASACADLLDIAEDPQLVPPDPWVCKDTGDKKDTMAPPPAMRNKAHVIVHACDLVTSNCSAAVTGVTAKLCNKLDVTCMTPINGAAIKDVDGDLMFDVPTGGALGEGFDGYLMVDGPRLDCRKSPEAVPCLLVPMCKQDATDENCTVSIYITALLFFNPPITHDSTEPIILPLIQNAEALRLVAAAGAGMVDPTLGSVFATILDCNGQPAAGMTFGTSKNKVQYATLFQVNGVVTNMATATDSSGIGGLLGVPEGFATVSAFPAGTTREVAKIGVQIVPGTVTYVTLIPPRS